MNWGSVAELGGFVLSAGGIIFVAGYNYNQYKQGQRENQMLWNTLNAAKLDINGLGAKINKVDGARRKLAIAVLTKDNAKLTRSAEE